MSKLISFPYDDSVAMRNAIYAGNIAEICRIHYSRYPDDPGAKEWLEQQEKAHQSAASTASEGETAQSVLSQESQQAAPERTEDPSETLRNQLANVDYVLNVDATWKAKNKEIADLAAELSRLRGLLESDRLKEFLSDFDCNYKHGADAETYYATLADKLREYLLPQLAEKEKL